MDPGQRNLVGPSRPGPGRNYGDTVVFYVFPKNGERAANPFFSKKKKTPEHPLNDWYLFEKRVLPSLHNFAWSWLEHGVQTEVSFFWGPKIRIMARKFCCRTPDFVNSLFKILGEKVDLALSDRCFDFSCPSCGRFRKKNLADAVTVFPLPTVGRGKTFWRVN